MKKSILNLGKVLGNVELREINGSGFACYCNGKYVGEASSISECWNKCPAKDIKSL